VSWGTLTGPGILGVVTEPSTPEPDPAEEAPQHQPGNPAKRPVEPRIGDADRDRAVGFLQEHMAQGRIDASEFDDRMSRALKAKTASELAVLFEDLPEPRPASAADTTGYQAPPWQQAAQRTFEIPPWQRTPAASPERARRAHPAVPERSKADTVLAVAAAASWPAVILFCFATSWSYWWLIFIPIFISSIAGSLKQRRSHNK
jgi:Domain of unknown function (DUF1707)